MFIYNQYPLSSSDRWDQLTVVYGTSVAHMQTLRGHRHNAVQSTVSARRQWHHLALASVLVYFVNFIAYGGRGKERIELVGW